MGASKMLDTALHQLVFSSTDFTALAATRLYPVLLPDDSPLPASTYQRISTTALYTLNDRVNVTKCRMQFDTWAKTYLDAKNLMKAINDVLDSYSGTLSDGTHIFGIQLYSCSDRFESAAHIYGVTADYVIQYADPVS